MHRYTNAADCIFKMGIATSFLTAGSEANHRINSTGVALGVSFTLLGTLLLICATIGFILTFKSKIKGSKTENVNQEPRYNK